ncbi:MAG: hypothetical protein H0V81_00665 [Solirubrobacterales bacterium]|nr:hypothetical protein [Solirubrobacterales bacterium]
MSSPPGQRSVKIANDERLGWSSDRPRRDGMPDRPADISVRGRVLSPSDRLRYSPGSLLLIVSPSLKERDAFVDRLIEERSAFFSHAKVRSLIEGRVPADVLDEKANELLQAAVLKRLGSGETVVVALDTLTPEERERYVRPAAALKRPRHLILLETGKDSVAEEDRAALNELRRALDAGQLGAEGIQTSLRLGGATISEVKKVVFRPPPRDDD